MFTALSTGAIGYVSTSLFTNISPIRASSFLILTCLIDQVVAPWVATHLEEYREDPLTPIFGQALHLVFSATTANLFCHGVRIGLSTAEAALVTGWMLIALLVTLMTIRIFKNLFSV